MCNLKSNKNLNEILEYKKELNDLQFSNINFILFPSFIYLSIFFDVKYKIGSQNISKYSEGSHTGEVLASQLKKMKVSYTLINHTETHEKHKNIIRKIKNATEANIKVVLCIGEKSKSQDALSILIKDIKEIFDELSESEKENIILAYEPSYAINSDDPINPEKLKIIIKKLKQFILDYYFLSIQIIYGGSINTNNILNLSQIDNIDGFLLGNSANNPKNIDQILKTIQISTQFYEN